MRFLILLLILASISPAYAQISCMDLFSQSRPSEEQLNASIYDLKDLLSEQYSKDSTVARFAKSESKNKVSELLKFMPLSEIKERLHNINIKNSALSKEQEQFRQSGDKVLLEIAALDAFLKEHKFKDVYDVNRFGETPLIVASEKGLRDIAEIIIKSGVNIEATTSNMKRTALIVASKSNQKSIVELLLKNGANINAKDKNDSTALILAVINNHKEITELLLQNGADLNIKSDNGDTALLKATLYKIQQRISELLIHSGADVNAKNNDGYTALLRATTDGKIDLVELLIQKGADVNAIDNFGTTALMQASYQNNIKIAELLIKNGANFNMKNNADLTAYAIAVRNTNIILASILKEAGATE